MSDNQDLFESALEAIKQWKLEKLVDLLESTEVNFTEKQGARLLNALNHKIPVSGQAYTRDDLYNIDDVQDIDVYDYFDVDAVEQAARAENLIRKSMGEYVYYGFNASKGVLHTVDARLDHLFDADPEIRTTEMPYALARNMHQNQRQAGADGKVFNGKFNSQFEAHWDIEQSMPTPSEIHDSGVCFVQKARGGRGGDYYNGLVAVHTSEAETAKARKALAQRYVKDWAIEREPNRNQKHRDDSIVFFPLSAEYEPLAKIKTRQGHRLDYVNIAGKPLSVGAAQARERTYCRNNGLKESAIISDTPEAGVYLISDIPDHDNPNKKHVYGMVAVQKQKGLSDAQLHAQAKEEFAKWAAAHQDYGDPHRSAPPEALSDPTALEAGAQGEQLASVVELKQTQQRPRS